MFLLLLGRLLRLFLVEGVEIFRHGNKEIIGGLFRRADDFVEIGREDLAEGLQIGGFLLSGEELAVAVEGLARELEVLVVVIGVEGIDKGLVELVELVLEHTDGRIVIDIEMAVLPRIDAVVALGIGLHVGIGVLVDLDELVVDEDRPDLAGKGVVEADIGLDGLLEGFLKLALSL